MDLSIFVFIIFGFIAQMIDGSLGMAYGVSANSFLLTVGLSPAVASASVHASEIVTTLVSGISHWKFGNIDQRMFLRLLIPGVIGGALGAYILTALDGNLIKPYISIYLLIMGIRILYKAFKPTWQTLIRNRRAGCWWRWAWQAALVMPLVAVGVSRDLTLISTGHSQNHWLGEFSNSLTHLMNRLFLSSPSM